MAGKFNLTATLNLRLGTSVGKTVAQLQSQLKNISATVKIDIPQSSKIGGLSRSLGNLAQKLDRVEKAALAANIALGQIQGKLGNFNLSNLNNVSIQFRNVQSGAKKTSANIADITDNLERFGAQAGLAIRRYSAFIAVTSITFKFIDAMRSGLQQAFEFQKELVRLSIVSGRTTFALSPLTKEITRLSTTFGVSSGDLAKTATTLAQAGLTANQTKVALDALAKTTLAPTFENIQSTTEGAIAILSQFGGGVEDLENKLNKVNAVAAAFAVESSDIVEAIKRTGGAFKASGGNFEELISLFTSVRSTTRESAETIATGFRTIFARLQRKDTLDFLRNLNIELEESNRFVGPFEAIRRLGAALKALPEGDVRRINIVEEIGGLRQISKVIPLLEQFDIALKAQAVSQASANSLTIDAAKAQESLIQKVNVLKESFLELFRLVSDNTFLKSTIDVVLDLGGALLNVAKAASSASILFGAFALAKGARALPKIFKGFTQEILGTRALLEQGASSQTPTLKARIENNSQLALNTAALKALAVPLDRLALKGTSFVPISALGPKVKKAAGGLVPGQGNTDSVSALLTPGEFVINKESSKKIGLANLTRLNRFHSGGPVRFGPNQPVGGGIFSGVNPAVFKFLETQAKKLGLSLEDLAIKIIALDSKIAQSLGLAVEGIDVPATRRERKQEGRQRQREQRDSERARARTQFVLEKSRQLDSLRLKRGIPPQSLSITGFGQAPTSNTITRLGGPGTLVGPRLLTHRPNLPTGVLAGGLPVALTTQEKIARARQLDSSRGIPLASGPIGQRGFFRGDRQAARELFNARRRARSSASTPPGFFVRPPQDEISNFLTEGEAARFLGSGPDRTRAAISPGVVGPNFLQSPQARSLAAQSLRNRRGGGGGGGFGGLGGIPTFRGLGNQFKEATQSTRGQLGLGALAAFAPALLQSTFGSVEDVPKNKRESAKFATAAGAGLTGFATGTFLGGPIAGAVAGITTFGIALNDEAEKIKAIEFGENLEKLSNKLKVFNAGGTTNTQSIIDISKLLGNEAKRASPLLGQEGPSFIENFRRWFGADIEQERIDARQAFTGTQGRALLPSFIDALNKIVKERRFPQGIGAGSIGEAGNILVTEIARIREISPAEVFAELNKQLQTTIEAEAKAANRLQAMAESIDIFTRANILVDVAQDAADSLQGFARSLENTESVLKGGTLGVSGPEFNKIGRFGETFDVQGLRSEIVAITSVFGQEGKVLRDNAIELDQALRVLPNIIAAGARSADAKNIFSFLGTELQRAGIGQDLARRLTRIAEDIFPDDESGFIDQSRKNAQDVAKKIAQGAGADEIQKAVEGIGKIFSEQFKTLSESINKSIQFQLQVDEKIQQVGQARLDVIRTQAEFNKKELTLEQLRQPFIDTQESLTGRRGIGLSPGAIGAARGDALRRAEASQKAFEEASKKGIGNAEEVKKLGDQFRKDATAAARLGVALDNLTKNANLAASAEEKLGRVNREREQLLGLGQQIAFGGGIQRQELFRNIGLTSRVIQQGNLQNVPDDLKQDVLGLLNSLGDVKLPGFNNVDFRERARQVTENELVRQGLSKEDAALFAAAITPEQDRLQKEIVAAMKIAADALAVQQNEQAGLVAKFLTDTNTQFDGFVNKLKVVLDQFLTKRKGEQIFLAENQIDAAQRKIRTAESLRDKFGGLPVAGALVQNEDLFTSQIKLQKESDNLFHQFRNAQKENFNIFGLKSLKGKSPLGIVDAESNKLTDLLNKKGVLNPQDIQFFNTNLLDSIKALRPQDTRDPAILNELVKKTLINTLGIQGSRITEEKGNNARKFREQFPQLDIKLLDTLGKDFGDLKIAVESLHLKDLVTGFETLQKQLDEANAALKAAQGLRKGGPVYANRGMFTPRGTDTVPAMLTPGEFVVNARATAANRDVLEQINSGFSKGGPVYARRGQFIPRNVKTREELLEERRAQAEASRNQKQDDLISSFNLPHQGASGTAASIAIQKRQQQVNKKFLENAGVLANPLNREQRQQQRDRIQVSNFRDAQRQAAHRGEDLQRGFLGVDEARKKAAALGIGRRERPDVRQSRSDAQDIFDKVRNKAIESQINFIDNAARNRDRLEQARRKREEELKDREFIFSPHRRTRRINPQERAARARGGFAQGGVVQRFQAGGPVNSPDLSNVFASFNTAISNFIQNTSGFVTALNNFPREIQLQGKHQVEVIVNGAEALNRMMPEIKELVVQETQKALRGKLKSTFGGEGNVDFIS